MYIEVKAFCSCGSRTSPLVTNCARALILVLGQMKRTFI